MNYPNTDDLNTFLIYCEAQLLDEKSKKEVKYPDSCISKWNCDGILNANKALLKELSGSANVYAIFTANKDSTNYTLKYIGQSESKLAKARLTNHLIQKNGKTGAKLEEVKKHIQSGGKIKISWILVKPESLRHFIEEELIGKHPECCWNQHAKKKT
jgi:predicted small secreted protein